MENCDIADILSVVGSPLPFLLHGVLHYDDSSGNGFDGAAFYFILPS